MTMSPRASSRRHLSASLALGAVLVLLLVAVAALALVWTPYPPDAIAVSHRLQPPSTAHWFGTDALGRDILSRLMAGAGVSIRVGVIAVGIGAAFGVALGLVAASVKGRLEDIIMQLSDFTFAFPALLSAIMLTATYGAGITNAVLAIGIYNVPVFAKLTRALANSLLAREFVQSARVSGRGPVGIAWYHVLPNILPALIVQATIQFSIAILAEAALSYLGFGTQPPEASWGLMLSEAQNFLFVAPRLAIFPGVAIALSVLGLNLLGDGLRDALDPRLRGLGHDVG